MVAAPLRHTCVEQFQLLEPIFLHGENPTRCAWTGVNIRSVANRARVGSDKVHVPFVPPEDGRRLEVPPPILLRNDVQCRHNEGLWLLPDSVEQRLQPHPVHDAMRLHEHEDRGAGCSHAAHLGADEPLPLRQLDDLHLRRHRLERLLPRVRVAVGDEDHLLHQGLRGVLQKRLHRTFHVRPLLFEPRDDDRHPHVAHRWIVPRWATSRPRVWRHCEGGPAGVDVLALRGTAVLDPHAPAPPPPALAIAPALPMALRTIRTRGRVVASAIHLRRAAGQRQRHQEGQWERGAHSGRSTGTGFRGEKGAHRIGV
mmetsp:Transcript_55668/g.169388  ORF Transcript_55668/g.169388 Transcript_55668/m.169388 type:complete len:312 (+) Transcript_55668:523-1458(+)